MSIGAEAIRTRDVDVERFIVRLRSNVHRSADRSIRSAELARLLHHKPRLPRPDNEILAAWVIRGAKRAGGCPVDDPTWDYDPGDSGPNALQTATVRCLVPKDDAERAIFEGLRLPPSLQRFRFIHPDDVPSPTALWEG